MGSSEAEQLSSLVGLTYDAALDPGLWPGALEAAAKFVGGTASVLSSYDQVSPRANFDLTWNSDPASLPRYKENFLPPDPLLPATLTSDIGEVVGLVERWPDENFRESRIYKEVCAPQKWVDGVQVTLDKSLTGTAVLMVARHLTQGLADDGARARMKLAFPHFRRAVLIGRMLHVHRVQAGALADVMDGLAAAVFLVDSSARVVSANAAGEDMVASAKLVRKAGDVLSICSDAAADNALRVAITAAGAGDVSIGARGVAVPIGRDGEEQYVAHVLPLGSGARRKAALHYSATAAIFVRATALGEASVLTAMGQLFDLTRSELRILRGIIEIGGIPAVATAFDISEETVKSHLKHIFEKTGTNRQADLVRLVASLTSPFKSDRDSTTPG